MIAEHILYIIQYCHLGLKRKEFVQKSWKYHVVLFPYVGIWLKVEVLYVNQVNSL